MLSSGKLPNSVCQDALCVEINRHVLNYLIYKVNYAHMVYINNYLSQHDSAHVGF